MYLKGSFDKYYRNSGTWVSEEEMYRKGTWVREEEKKKYIINRPKIDLRLPRRD
jgi:hypothetical protein